MDQISHNLKALYLVPNPFQIWSWVLTPLAILFLFKGTRRFGGTGFVVVLVCMGIFFALQKMMGDFAPKPLLEPAPGKKHAAPSKRPW